MLKPVYGVSDSCSFQVRWFLTTRSSRWDMMRRRFDQASIGPCKAWLQILSFWTWFFEVQRPECIFWDDSILSNSDPPVTHQHYYLSIGFYYITLSFSSTFPVGFESQFNPQKYHQSFCQYPFVMLKNTLPTLNWARLNSVFSGVFFFCAEKKHLSRLCGADQFLHETSLKFLVCTGKSLWRIAIFLGYTLSHRNPAEAMLKTPWVFQKILSLKITSK